MKNQKKFLGLRILMAVIVLLTFFVMAGCGKEEGETTLAPETTEASTEETTEETTPAPTEPPTLDVSEIRVGMIFYGEENDGSLLSRSLYEEMVEAALYAGMEEDQILVQYHGREAEWTQIEDGILSCIDSGCQLILGCSREYEAVIAAIAEEYPEVMFACVGSQLYNGMNGGTFTVDTAVAQYLCGAMAGMEGDDRVGFVAAKGSDDERVTEAVNAFAYGVWSTNPEAIVDVAVIGKWFLPGAEEKALTYLQNLGCESIGSNTDMSIGSLEYRWRQYFSMKLEQIIEKQVVGEAWIGDYYGDALVCIRDSVQLPDYVLEKIEEWDPETPETLPEETTAPYEIPDIEIDPDTGYLTNVRVHKIQWTEE